MYKFILSDTGSDNEIYVNLIRSPAGRYLSRRPHLVSLIKDILSERKIAGERTVIEEVMDRNIGTSDVVATTGDDSIYYAQPIKSETFFRFAKNRYPHPSHTLTIVIEKDSDGNYEVTNTWIGPYYPAFPGDKHESAGSKKYWENHALVHDARMIQVKSITKVCPY